MKKQVKLIIQLILFMVILILIYFGYNYLSKRTIQENNYKNEEDIMEIKEIKNVEEFNEIINSNECVLVDFYATWCTPCKMVSPIIEKIAKEHNNVKTIKVDVDNNEELAIKYNIMSIPTIVIFKNGNISKTFVGVTDEDSITSEF